MAPHQDSPHSQSATSGCHLRDHLHSTHDWTTIDDEFRTIIAPIHATLACDEVGVEEAAEIFSDLLSSHLQHHDVIRVTDQRDKSTTHRPRAIVRLTERLAKAKNIQRRQFKTHPREFLDAVRLHNRVKKAADNATISRSTRQQEKAFRSNPWVFSKSICNPKSQTVPHFTMEEGLKHFKPSFETSKDPKYSSLPTWVADVMPQPVTTTLEFDMSPVRPKLIKKTLKKLSNASAPGPDKISYFHLKSLPSTHHYLATLFSKILLKSPCAPASWCKGNLRLIHKSGDPTNPANFRPIALTSTIGKLFNRILASRLERYMMDNAIINSEVQKGFLSGVAGVFEHILSLNAIIDNARMHGLPLSMTFIDLRNAFGSIPHQLILDMLHHILVPSQVTTYVADMYSKLTASISTSKWCTPPFQITKGIFQGDTLSPLLFLLCYHPVIAYAEKLPTTGFKMTSTVPNSAGLPPVDSYIYIEWQEESSEEPDGWYHCQVQEYQPDGQAILRYRDGALETININTIKWHFAQKSSKAFLPITSVPPQHPLKKVRAAALQPKQTQTTPRSVMGYADDTTLLSTSPKDHQSALKDIDHKCSDLGLEIRPDKCISYVFDGKKVNNRTTFKVHQGSTRNITSAPTKFLGQVIGATPTNTKLHAGKKITERVYTALNEIDWRHIRGEYKAWIYKFYLVPSLLFNLTVDRISQSTINKLQTRVTSFLKRWLRIPRCATLASIFHPDVTNFPYLPHVQEKAKLRLLAQVRLSQDRSIKEIEDLILDPEFAKRESIPSRSLDIISGPPPASSSTQTIALMKLPNSSLIKEHAAHWSHHLESLSV